MLEKGLADLLRQPGTCQVRKSVLRRRACLRWRCLAGSACFFWGILKTSGFHGSYQRGTGSRSLVENWTRGSWAILWKVCFYV